MKYWNRKHHLSVFFFLFIGGALLAQKAIITGLVSETNGPLAFATVSFDGTSIGTSTDEQGRFELEADPGQHILVASYVGCRAKKKSIVLEAGQQLEVNFTLEALASEMEAVVVTGTMKPTYVSDSPIKVEVITARQLETFLPSAGASIMDNLQLVNGVQEVVACGVCFTNSISINGLPGPYTAVLMDGTPIYGNLASVYGLNGIPNMIIDRFEVIKGPSSTLYGSEAVAGVINIITKDPAKQPVLSVDIMGTTHLESFGNIAVAPKIGNSTGFIGLNYAYLNDFEDFNQDGFGDGINMDRISLFSKWNLHRKIGKTFTLAGKYYYEDRRNGVEQFLQNRNYRQLRGDATIYGESIYTHRAELFGTFVFDTQADLKIDFSLSHHDQDSYYGSDYYRATQQIAFANLIWNVETPKHDFLFGLTSRYNAYDDNSAATETLQNGQLLNQPNNQFIPGIFVQDEWTPNEKWTLLPGLRLDHYQAHGPILAPRLSVKYKPGTYTTLRSNFGTGFRIVNLFTEDHAFITGQRQVEITEALEPEQSYNLSLNVIQVYAGLGGSGTLDLEGYFTHFTNKILPDYDTPGKIIYANSEGYARTMGLGLSLNHQFLIPLAFNLGLNVQRVTETEPDENGQLQTRAVEFAPRWSGILTLNYDWKAAGLVVAYTARATGPMALPEVFDLGSDGEPLPNPRPTVSQPFSLHNFQVSKRFDEQWSIYAGLQNIFDFRQQTSPLIGYNDPTAPLGFSDYFDTSYAYAPLHGREFYLGVQWKLARKQDGD